MFENWKQLIPSDFNDGSRVWIYQASRFFFMSEALEIEAMLEDFVESWQSHGHPVKGYGNLLFGQFIILMADEAQSSVSGCSTDSSVRLIKSVEEKFRVTMFDRMNLAFVVKDKVELLPLAHLNHAMENGFITSETIYFNNTILNKKALLNQWLIPVKDSWLAGRLQTHAKTS
ncbi:MAG: hypothetical protein ABIX01_02855 [Chitinophagaceae bacterium]